MVGNEAFLEASVENCTRAPLVLEYVRIDPATGLSAVPISNAPTHSSQQGIQFEEWMENVQVSVAPLGIRIRNCENRGDDAEG